MATFYIRTYYPSGQTAYGCHVTLAFHGFSRGNTRTVSTNSDGLAVISGYDEGEADIIVDGRTRMSRVYVSDGDTYEVTI